MKRQLVGQVSGQALMTEYIKRVRSAEGCWHGPTQPDHQKSSYRQVQIVSRYIRSCIVAIVGLLAQWGAEIRFLCSGIGELGLLQGGISKMHVSHDQQCEHEYWRCSYSFHDDCSYLAYLPQFSAV